jgi:nicotinamide-nucleotide amidase
MARGAALVTGADVTIAITGIAGPGGGTAQKPVGTVWFGIAGRQRAVRSSATLRIFAGDREAVRRQAVGCALQLILQQALP